ncbi:MAG: cysteine desulfurase [Bacilli bacterium]|nr:cysteine desulfurase [Bacilli bacterium]MDD4808970.1 cysteine desulfurase [Bacilli bacterium]
MNREDFLMLQNNLIYLDNGATTLKPKILSEVTADYYNNYSANAHRGDYNISLKVDTMYEQTRQLVKDFINAKSTKEIIFTSGSTDSLNKIIFGYFKYHLNKDDEVLITKSEHASNILPWFELEEELKIKVKYIDLTSDLKVTLDNLKKAVTSKTKVISIAHITNVAGDIRPIKEIINYAHQNNILVLIDGAQSVAHLPYDVQTLDVDFLAFSAHKMCGPTGVGVIYGKEELLEKIKPIVVGGGMNATFDSNKERVYSDLPHRLEAGTPNIAGVIGYGSTIEYLNKIGMDVIHTYEINLRNYALKELEKVPNIIIYNKTSESGIIAFNIDGIFAQDLAIYLNKHHICVRAGNHCAKILKDEIGVKNTCRLSLYFYNTTNEIDKLVEVLKNPYILDEVI